MILNRWTTFRRFCFVLYTSHCINAKYVWKGLWKLHLIVEVCWEQRIWINSDRQIFNAIYILNYKAHFVVLAKDVTLKCKAKVCT